VPNPVGIGLARNRRGAKRPSEPRAERRPPGRGRSGRRDRGNQIFL